MLNRFHSAVLVAHDFDLALANYSTLLGRAASWIGTDPSDGAKVALFRLENMCLEIRGLGTAGDAAEGLSGFRLQGDEDVDLGAWLKERGSAALEAEKKFVHGADAAPNREWTEWRVEPESSRGIDIALVTEKDAPILPAATEVDPQSIIRDLDHVVVFSEDVDATRDFYRDRLGLRLALDKSFDERGVRLLFFRLGGVTIEIGGRLGAPPTSESSDRFGGLAWEVVDIDRIRERLSGENFDVSEVRKGHKEGTRVCTVRAPTHGVPTLLIEPVSR